MKSFRFGWAFLAILVLWIAILDLLMLAVGYSIGLQHLTREEGPLEVLQLVLLAVAALAFAAAIPRATGAAQLIASGAASLSLMFFFREFETPVDNPVLDFMSHDSFLYLLFAALGAFMLTQAYRNRIHIPAFFGWLIRIEFWPFLLGGTLLVAAEVFEQFHLQSVEEFLEIDGHFVIAATAIAAWYRAAGVPKLSHIGTRTLSPQ